MAVTDEEEYIGIWDENSNTCYCLTCAEELYPGITKDEDTMGYAGIDKINAQLHDDFCNKCKGVLN